MKTTLVRLALAAGLSLAATAASANYYCVTSSTTARSGPGSSYGSVGALRPGMEIYGLWNIHGWKKIKRPSGGFYFVNPGALSRGKCPEMRKRAPAVVHAAPSRKSYGHRRHCGGCGYKGH